MSDPTAVLGLEPDDLDGHTIDELTDYLERGRRPADPSIDNSPACQIALGALQRLRTIAGSFLDHAATGVDTPSTDQDWISAALAAIPIDARAGRHFTWPSSEPEVAAHTTEGAIRGLIRTIGDDIPGLLVGAVRLGNGRPTDLDIDVALVYGAPLVPAIAAFRDALTRALPNHTPFPVGKIDITVVGLIDTPRTSRGTR